MQKLLIGTGLAILLALGWLAFSGRFNKAVAPTTEQSAITTTAPAQGTPKLIIGDPAARVTIIQYTDFQCPICKRFFEQTEPQLLREYINTGKANLEIRVEAHIGAKSVRAGEAAYCANDQGKFKGYHDELYRQQGVIDFTDGNLKNFAGEVGLDQDQFNNCFDKRKYKAAVEASHQEAQSRISGTPTFYIGSQRINGAQPFSVFKTVIDGQL